MKFAGNTLWSCAGEKVADREEHWKYYTGMDWISKTESSFNLLTREGMRRP